MSSPRREGGFASLPLPEPGRWALGTPPLADISDSLPVGSPNPTVLGQRSSTAGAFREVTGRARV
jgi:hypothetical protein